jgi:hypothetical protein
MADAQDFAGFVVGRLGALAIRECTRERFLFDHNGGSMQIARASDGKLSAHVTRPDYPGRLKQLESDLTRFFRRRRAVA